MKRKKILAVGNSVNQDFAAFNEIKNCLDKNKIDIVLYKQDKCLEDNFLLFESCKNKISFNVVSNEGVLDINSVSGVLYFHPILPRKILSFQPHEYSVFMSKQYHSMRESLWSILSDKLWVNNPWNNYKADNKILQLNLASIVGLKIPDTLITNSPDKIIDFYFSNNKNIIVKSLANSPILDNVSFTRKVNKSDIKDIESLIITPAIYQNNIPKKYELRITVVGSSIFPTKILSQEDKATSIDWRVKPKLNDFDLKMESTTIPKKIENKILLLMSKLGLTYGAIDMIVTDSGDYVFLEINPSGQWYFIQQRTNVQIAKAIAQIFV